MKQQEWLDLIDDQYLEEAMDYTPPQTAVGKRHWLRWSAIAAAVLVLLVSTTLIIVMAQRRSPSQGGNISGNSAGMMQETPVSIYWSGGGQQGHYVSMNTNEAVTIDNTYIPEGSTRWEGIGFQVSMKNCRIDATTDNGYFLGNNDQSNDCYTFGYNSLSLTWRPFGTGNFWGQEANIRLYAMKENVLYMYAVVHIAAPNQHCFAAEIIQYEDFTDKGGCAITEENRNIYYPSGTTIAKTCDISEVRSGQTPHYLPLNILQPIAMKITPYDKEQSMYYWNTSDFRRFLPFAVPFVAESPGHDIALRNSQAILYSPDAERTEEEMPQYLIDQGLYYLLDGKPVASPIGEIDTTLRSFSDSTGTAYGLLVPSITDISDEGRSHHSDMRLEIAGYSEAGEYCVYALAIVSTYCVRQEMDESIIVIQRYEDYTDIGGISMDSSIYKNFGQAPIQDRIQNILDITPQYSDNELETLLRWKPTPIMSLETHDRYFNPPTIESMRAYYSRTPTKQVVVSLLDLYPYASDETLAKLAGYRIANGTEQDYDPCPRLTAQILGTMPENAPRMSLEQALAIIENIRQEINDCNGEMDADTHYNFQRDMKEIFNEAAGAPDKVYRQDPSINRDYGDRSAITYLLSDGTLFHVGFRFGAFYIRYYHPDDTEAVIPLEVVVHPSAEPHSDSHLEVKEPYTTPRKASSSPEQ